MFETIVVDCWTESNVFIWPTLAGERNHFDACSFICCMKITTSRKQRPQMTEMIFIHVQKVINNLICKVLGSESRTSVWWDDISTKLSVLYFFLVCGLNLDLHVLRVHHRLSNELICQETL